MLLVYKILEATSLSGTKTICSIVKPFSVSTSKDILLRWTFPLVPDDNYPGGARYDYIRGQQYRPKNHSAVLARFVEFYAIATTPLTPIQDL